MTSRRLQRWFEVLPGAMGVEDLVVKAANSRYVAQARRRLSRGLCEAET
jgi:hypothetical protein